MSNINEMSIEEIFNHVVDRCRSTNNPVIIAYDTPDDGIWMRTYRDFCCYGMCERIQQKIKLEWESQDAQDAQNT